MRKREKPKQFKETLKRLMQYIRPHLLRIMIVFIAAILGTVFAIVGPKVMGDVITVIFEGAYGQIQGQADGGIDFTKVTQLLAILAGLYIFSSLFRFIQGFLMASVAQRIVYRMREQIFSKLQRLPLKYYDETSHGDTLSRVTNDLDTIGSTLQQSITQLITSIVTIVGILFMMFYISPLLTVIALVSLPLSIFVIRPLLQRSQRYFAKQQQSLGKLNGHIEEMYTGHVLVKSYGQEEEALEQFDQVNENLFDAGRRAQFISGIIMPVMSFIGNLSYVIISIVGGFLVINRLISIGDIQAFITYTRQFSQPITQTANIANIIQSTIAAAERVFELLDEEEEVLEAVKHHLDHAQGNVDFIDVDFGYDNDLLMKNLNISAKKGQTIAIVGPTGAGKTTLINLLMRFYELKGGKITIDGVDLTDLSRKNLRSQFGMVLQDTWLFKGSIKENIGYGKSKSKAREEEIIAAAKAARAHPFIMALPKGYDFELNENASNISQGQRQLLTIARAILADSPMMILDEATSSVDTRTEILIQQAMKELMKGRTSFVIAHRLSTIRDADLILVMDQGAVIEQGTHEELLDQQGFYAQLYQSQFSQVG